MSRSTVDERFWSKVVKEPSCWRWTAARFSTGTGQFRVGQKMRQAHRVAWELTYGSPPPALLRSTCGNLQCVRPEHHVPADRMGGATNLARTVDKRFDAMVEKGPGCWQWTGSTTRMGYGQFGVMVPGEGRRMIPAHRYAWERASGAIPDGVDVLHLCGNRICVRPDHLALRDPGETRRDEAAMPLTIVLDPGHGGHDTGAIGPSGLMEKDVVLDLAVRLRKLLQDRLGVRVLMTRSGDVFVPLSERSAIANRAKADFMISLHVNAANSRGAVGFETFYFTREPSDSDARASAQRENLVIESNGSTGKDLDHLLKATLADMAVTRDMKESSSLAERILAALDKILKVDNRGVKSGPFYVLATAAMPAVLVESAFITNPREERRLQREEYRQRIAEGLYEGVAAYKIRYEQRLGLRAVPAGVGS